ncbi:MAG: DUF3179 domain-containing (seleno)protein [Planctomycetota bacterium]
MNTESAPPPRAIRPLSGLLLLVGTLVFILGSMEGVRWLYRLSPPDPLNGFSAEGLRVPAEELERAEAAGMLRALEGFPPMPAAEAEALKMRSGNPVFLVRGDRVAVISIGGETRGYPLRVLVFHEVVNDILGGVPITIVHHPVSGAVIAFERRFQEETLSFAPSMVLLDSNPLLFDRPPGDDPALLSTCGLWSPLIGECLSGPRAGTRLRRLPLRVTTWEEFKASVPAPHVVGPHPKYVKAYRKDLYNQYEGMGIPRFRHDPRPPTEAEGGRPAFDRMLVLSAGEPAEVRALSLRELARESAPRVELGGATLTLEWLDRDAGAIRVASVEGGPLHWSGEVYWFVWYAHRERVIASP